MAPHPQPLSQSWGTKIEACVNDQNGRECGRVLLWVPTCVGRSVKPREFHRNTVYLGAAWFSSQAYLFGISGPSSNASQESGTTKSHVIGSFPTLWANLCSGHTFRRCRGDGNVIPGGNKLGSIRNYLSARN